MKSHVRTAPESPAPVKHNPQPKTKTRTAFLFSVFPGRFAAVNFAIRKHDIDFALMNQLATAEKRFPRSEQDIATDYAALRKSFHGNRWIFREGTNTSNPASHCDIAWAGGLVTEASNSQGEGIGAMVGW